MHETTLQILLALRREPSEAGQVLEHLRALVGEEAMPSLATFYRCLKAGMDSGWVEVAGERPAEGPGRPAQIYAMTAAGERALEAEARRLESLAEMARASGSAQRSGSG